MLHLHLSCKDFSENKEEKQNRKQSFWDKNDFRDIADQIKRPIDVCKRKSETGLSLVA